MKTAVVTHEGEGEKEKKGEGSLKGKDEGEDEEEMKGDGSSKGKDEFEGEHNEKMKGNGSSEGKDEGEHEEDVKQNSNLKGKRRAKITRRERMLAELMNPHPGRQLGLVWEAYSHCSKEGCAFSKTVALRQAYELHSSHTEGIIST